MTKHPVAMGTRARTATGLALASRGDALTPQLAEALERRFGPMPMISPELTAAQRYLVAGATFRPIRERWVERFYKSGLAWRLRSRNADRLLRALPSEPSVVFQVHALFAMTAAPTVLYVDCTHHQSADLWPAWNPLRGRSLDAWYRRERETYQGAEHIFAFTAVTRESLIRDYGVDPDRVTVTGTAPFRAAPQDVPDRSGDSAPMILFVGNDFVRKGGPELLTAFRTVRSSIPDARLVLVGTPPSLPPEENVEVLGRIRDERRMAELFEQASVFVLPSIFDPLPGALLEAMAYALPVVATRQMGVPDVVVDGRNGRLIEPGRVPDLAAALLGILSDPEHGARLGAAARRDVIDRFTWDAVVDRMAPVLEPLIRKR